MESSQNDSPTADSIAYLESQGIATDDEDEDDIHFCKKCKQVFKKLETYLEHKVKHDQFKVAYNRAPGDRRMVLPTLRKKASSERTEGATGQKEGEQLPDATHRPRKRRKRERQTVDVQLIAERNTYICTTCDRKFSREASLKWHIQYDHPQTEGESEEEEKQAWEEGEEMDDDQDVSFKLKEPVLKKVQVHSDEERPYKCDVCGLGFKEVAVLKTHMLTHSNVRQYKCTYDNCPYAFKTKGSLVRHLRRHTGERPYACESCGRSFAESGALTRHMRSRKPCTAKTDADLPRYGKKWTYVPNIPAVVSQVKSDDDSFVSMVPGEMVMVVTEGENGEQIFTEAQVVSNNETVSTLGEGVMEEGELGEREVGELVAASDLQALTPTQCKVCREECLEVVALRAHLRLHLADFPFHCGFCHFTTEERQDLRQHLQSKHLHELKGIDPNVLLPPTDNRSRRSDQQTTKDNTEAQTAVKQLLELPQDPPTDRDLTETLSARAISRCPICNRVFRGSSYLKQHMKSHAGDRPHECPVCHKSFVTKDALNKHLIVHTDERNYKCGVCDKLFKRIAHVREHLKIHSSDRPFPCSVCEKSFKTNNALKVHVRTHSQCYPYECRVCHRHFREKGSMQRHLRTHTGERPFICPRCGRGFAEHGTLNRHLKAKVQCVRYKQVHRVDRGEATLELQMEGEEEGEECVTSQSTAGDVPTVLAEFSSVVADTQQYIVADDLGNTDTETTEYVVLHTDLASSDIHNVEIVTEGDIDPDTILSTVAGSDSSLMVLSEAGNQLRIIDSSTGLTLATMPSTSQPLSGVRVLSTHQGPSGEGEDLSIIQGEGQVEDRADLTIGQEEGAQDRQRTEECEVVVPGSDLAGTITVLTDSSGHIILSHQDGEQQHPVVLGSDGDPHHHLQLPMVIASGSETADTVTVHTATETTNTVAASTATETAVTIQTATETADTVTIQTATEAADSVTAQTATETVDTVTIRTATETADSVTAQTATETADSVTAQTATETADSVTAQTATEAADTVIVQTATETADSVTVQTATETADTIRVKMATKTAGTVTPQTAKEAPDTVTVQIATETAEAVCGQTATETADAVCVQTATETANTVSVQPQKQLNLPAKSH